MTNLNLVYVNPIVEIIKQFQDWPKAAWIWYSYIVMQKQQNLGIS